MVNYNYFPLMLLLIQMVMMMMGVVVVVDQKLVDVMVHNEIDHLYEDKLMKMKRLLLVVLI